MTEKCPYRTWSIETVTFTIIYGFIVDHKLTVRPNLEGNPRLR